MLRLPVVLVAWWFAVTSGLTVAGIAAVHSWSDGATSRFWGLDDASGDPVFEAVGLTYRGTAGIALAATEAVVVALCLVLTLLDARRPRLARLGHLGLLAWSGLWLVNSTWYSVLDPHPVAVVITVVIAVCVACTAARARWAWTRLGTAAPADGAV